MIFPLSDSADDFYNSAVTKVGISEPERLLTGRGMFFMGSCFADYLYTEFHNAGLNVTVAPFGNIYNPASLSQAAAMLYSPEEAIAPSDCFAPGGNPGKASGDTSGKRGYRHFMFHSLKTAGTAEALSDTLNGELVEAHGYIRTCEAAVITLGTAFVYRLQTGSIVNNCHKLPSSKFTRSMMTVDECTSALNGMLKNLRRINPELRIILTISPVRHLRDNAAENSLSKAVLRCAAENFCKAENTWYFPSYEIMLDELRDYRWYAEDLCHPSASAVSFIISRFLDTVYDLNFKAFLKEWIPVLRDLNHRPFKPESEEYRLFHEKVLIRKKLINKKYPGILSRFSREQTDDRP